MKPQIRKNKLSLDSTAKLCNDITYRQAYIAKIKYVLPLLAGDPYMVWVSGNMFLYPPWKRHVIANKQSSNGLWKDAEEPGVKYSIYQLAKISRPTDEDLMMQEELYGYHMEWPPPHVGRWLPTAMKYFVGKQEEGEYGDVHFFPAVGIVDSSNGDYLPEYGKAIAGYFIMASEDEYVEAQKNFIASQKMWYRKQYIVAFANYVDHHLRIIKAAQKTIQRHQRELPYKERFGLCLPELSVELVEDLPDGLKAILDESR